MAAMDDCIAVILGGGRGTRLFPLTPALQAGRAHRRQVPAHRHPHQQLPQLRPPPDLRAHPVQLGEPQQAHQPDLQVRRLLRGLRHHPGRRADRGEPGVVPGHRRRRAPEPAPPPQPPRPRGAHPLGRPALPDGLPEAPATPTAAPRPTPPWPSSRSRREQTAGLGILKVDAHGPHRPLRGEAARRSGSTPSSRTSRATGAASSPRWASTCSRARRCEQRDRRPGAGRLRPARHPRRHRRRSGCRRTSPRLLGGRRDHRLLLPGEPGSCTDRIPPFDFYDALRAGLHPPPGPARDQGRGLHAARARSCRRAASSWGRRSSAR